MKKKTLITLSIIPLVLGLSACSKDNSTKARLHLSVAEPICDTEYFKYDFNLDDYIVVDGKLNYTIAKMSMLFDANASKSSRVEFKDAKYLTKDNNDFESFYKELQLDDFVHQSVGYDSELDSNDGTYYDFAHKKINVENQDYEIFFVAIQDSGASGVNWISNFDIGADNDVYYEISGEHPDWKDKNNHKGFDITAFRLLNDFENYRTAKLDSNAKQIIHVYGHSRGGAIGNLFAAKLIDLNYDVVSYCLASPTTTTNEHAQDDKYKNIHNIICSDDLITRVPAQEWGFTRFGETVSFSLKDYEKDFKKLTKLELPSGDTSSIAQMLSVLAENRYGVYTFDERYTVATSEPLEADKVQEYIDSYLSSFNDKYELLKKYVKVETSIDGEGLTTVKIITCPGFLTGFIASIVSIYDFNIRGAIKDFMTFSTYLNTFLKATGKNVTEFLSLNFTFVVICHYYYSYVSYFNNY